MVRFALFLFLGFILCSSKAYASSHFTPGAIPSVKTIDITSGYIPGEKAQFWLTIPRSWQGLISVDREKLDFSETGIEKLIFYYMPENKIYRPAAFMEFYVLDKRMWPNTQLKKIAETQKYIFAVQTFENTFTAATDIALFDYLLNQVSDDDLLIGLIGLPQDQRFLKSNTITVNGIMLKSKVYRDTGIVYAPVREVCEILGYSVGWLEKEQAVTISGHDKYFLMLTKNMELYQNYNVMNFSGKAYASLMFFVQLGLNVEVDEDYNVVLKE